MGIHDLKAGFWISSSKMAAGAVSLIPSFSHSVVPAPLEKHRETPAPAPDAVIFSGTEDTHRLLGNQTEEGADLNKQ